MPKVDTTPKNIRPFVFHGVNFTKQSDDEWSGDCPFCGDDRGKFGVKADTGQWHCFICGADGNVYTFIRKLHEGGPEPEETMEELRADRQFLSADTVSKWGLKTSTITGEWLFPGYGPKGGIDQLYRYAPATTNGKRILLSTWELDHGILGLNLFDPKKKTTYVCETWNAPALWEVLRVTKKVNDGSEVSYEVTSNPKLSLLANANVIGVPGANVWKDKWSHLLKEQDVVLMVDNDHDREVKGKTTEGAGIAGAKRTSGLLAKCTEAPSSISWLRWGKDGGGFEKDLKTGYDVRDFLSEAGDTKADRVKALGSLLTKIEPIPDDWIPGRGSGGVVGSPYLEPKECTSWSDLLPAWKLAMDWTGDLEHLLSVCLAAVLSTETLGQQLWVLAMAPPSSGKTSILEAIAVARDYVHSKSELNKVYSGYKDDKAGSEDFSIIPQIDNKTLIVMDGDAVITDPNRGKIMAQFRSLFDGVGRSHYNNGTSRNYQCRFTFIIAGTSRMREMDSTEAGARFLSCSINEHIDEGFERRINRHVFWRAVRNTRTMVNGSAMTRADSDMIEAKRRTAGYVQYLRWNAAELMAGVDLDPDRDADIEDRISDYGQLAAFLRARQPKYQDEVTEREMSARLVEQFARLAVCLAAVTGKKTVDQEVLQRVRRVALDTSRGRTLTAARSLFRAGMSGRTCGALAHDTGESDEKTGALLTFLVKIGVVERVPDQGIVRGHKKWRLTERLTNLYRSVVGVDEELANLESGAR